MFLDYEGEAFYQYAMSLFLKAGHVSTSTPEYCNHSAEQFVYFDKYDKNCIKKILSQSTIHKLTNKVDLDSIKKDSFYKKLLRNDKDLLSDIYE